MNISAYKNKALDRMKNKSTIISCTVKFMLITVLISYVSYNVQLHLKLNGYLLGTVLYTLITLGVKIFVDIINTQLTTAFIYMLIKGKTKFKRFFSFSHKKYLKYYLLNFAAISLPYQISNMIFDSNKDSNTGIALCGVILCTIIGILQNCMIYLKAAYPREDFQNIFKRAYNLIIGHIKKIIVFGVSFIPYAIAELFLIYIFFVRFDVYYNSILAFMLTHSLCGLGIFLIPYFILSFHYMAADLYKRDTYKMDKSIEQQFNLIAEEYDKNRKKFIPCFDDFYSKTTAFIAANISAPKHILDLGAGTGLLTYFWYEHFPSAEYLLVDIAEDMLEIAEKRFNGLDNVQCRIADYSKGLPEENFDVMISALSVHHLENDEKKNLFSRIYEALPDNGLFINYDQFCADEPEMNKWFDSYWEKSLSESGLTEHDINLWKERRKLDRECSVEQEIQMLYESGFKRVSCVYSCRKFAVITAGK